MREGYSVTVSKFGEPLLTIERTMLSGRATLSAEEQQAIREAAEHLLAFVGPERDDAFDAFERALDNPPKANEALRQLLSEKG
jgi:hypothetical protein